MKVRELFERLRGREAAVLPNPGNCGDGLIWMGLHALCREYDVRVLELDEPYPAEGEVLLVPAAGNLCGSYHSMTVLLAPYLSSFREIYILPCSVDVSDPEVERFLRSLPAHVHLFAREKYSYAQARFAIGDEARVHLDHDLAFSLDYSRWGAPGRGTLNAFRDDPESGGATIPKDNLDISALGSVGHGEILPRLLQHVAIVHSDRAHVSICAALLGKETHVYPNAYHKVRGIYEYSLREMPNVRFHGFDEIYAEATR
jgi:exopolysaccharide biosynthesis predicted pyruvyltransferase EpsI